MKILSKNQRADSLLMRGEVQELPYMVTNRVAKALGYLKHDPFEVREVIGDWVPPAL